MFSRKAVLYNFKTWILQFNLYRNCRIGKSCFECALLVITLYTHDHLYNNYVYVFSISYCIAYIWQILFVVQRYSWVARLVWVALGVSQTNSCTVNGTSLEITAHNSHTGNSQYSIQQPAQWVNLRKSTALGITIIHHNSYSIYTRTQDIQKSPHTTHTHAQDYRYYS